MEIQLTLPYPPSINHYWMHRGYRKFLGTKGKKFRVDVAQIVSECPATANLEPLTGRLGIRVDAYMPDRRKRDIDNILKATLDALEHTHIFLDDNQFDELQVYRCGVTKPGYIEITIKEL